MGAFIEDWVLRESTISMQGAGSEAVSDGGSDQRHTISRRYSNSSP